MDRITELLNSGTLHQQARQRHPDRVCSAGNVHVSAKRASFVTWRKRMAKLYGDDVKAWPEIARQEYSAKYAPSH